METKNLWSSLIKSDIKYEIYCPIDLSVSIDDYYSELKNLIFKERIPASIDMFNVTWDSTNLEQKRIIVKCIGDEVNSDVVQILIGLDKFGNYSYVEEKVFLNKPLLPVYPRTRNPKQRPSINPLGAFFLFCLYLIPGIIYVVNIKNKQKEYDQTVQVYNTYADQEQFAWDKSWETWEKEILHVSYLSSTNDVYGRFVHAISSLNKIVIKTLFEDKKAEIKDRVEKAFTEQQLKDELTKRKAEFK